MGGEAPERRVEDQMLARPPPSTAYAGPRGYQGNNLPSSL